jgi:hypothetical protein
MRRSPELASPDDGIVVSFFSIEYLNNAFLDVEDWPLPYNC